MLGLKWLAGANVTTFACDEISFASRLALAMTCGLSRVASHSLRHEVRFRSKATNKDVAVRHNPDREGYIAVPRRGDRIEGNLRCICRLLALLRPPPMSAVTAAFWGIPDIGRQWPDISICEHMPQQKAGDFGRPANSSTASILVSERSQARGARVRSAVQRSCDNF
jgi:hypothetical protein